MGRRPRFHSRSRVIALPNSLGGEWERPDHVSWSARLASCLLSTIMCDLYKSTRILADISVRSLSSYRITSMVAFTVLSQIAILCGILPTARAIANCMPGRLNIDPSIVDAVVTNTEFHNDSTVVNISNDFSSFNVDNFPGFCRIEILITTNSTANSTAHTEVWLPRPENWNQRSLTFGNGGFAGGGMSFIYNSYTSILPYLSNSERRRSRLHRYSTRLYALSRSSFPTC